VEPKTVSRASTPRRLPHDVAPQHGRAAQLNVAQKLGAPASRAPDMLSLIGDCSLLNVRWRLSHTHRRSCAVGGLRPRRRAPPWRAALVRTSPQRSVPPWGAGFRVPAGNSRRRSAAYREPDPSRASQIAHRSCAPRGGLAFLSVRETISLIRPMSRRGARPRPDAPFSFGLDARSPWPRHARRCGLGLSCIAVRRTGFGPSGHFRPARYAPH